MITKEELAFVERQVTRLIEAEEKLNEMSAEYGRAKASFDSLQAGRGITPDDPVGLVRYVEAKQLHPELGYWYAKVEHFMAEISARAALVSALSDVAWLRGELEEELPRAVIAFDEVYAPPRQPGRAA